MMERPLDLRPLQSGALIAGGVLLLLALVLALFVSPGFFQAYLNAYLLWLGLSLGCLVMLFVGHMAGGSWAALIQRPLEAGAAVLPVLALLFIPLLFGMGQLFPWTDAAFVESEPLVAAKAGYLNVPFFIARAILYFAIWIGGAFVYLRLSRRQDQEAEQAGKLGFRMRSLAGFWIVLYVLTMTFAAIDWGMSLTPLWFSGIYPAIHMIGQAISGISFIIVIMVFLAGRVAAVNELLTAKRLQDLGNFLMGFLMFWAYLNFSQLIIIWSNNTMETSPYYVARFADNWILVGAFLLLFGFFAPFVILFSRWVKRKRQALLAVAGFSLLIRVVDMFYILVPSFERPGSQLLLLDLLLLVGLGGIWLALYLRSLAARPILPLNDPRLVVDEGRAPAHGEAVSHA